MDQRNCYLTFVELYRKTTPGQSRKRILKLIRKEKNSSFGSRNWWVVKVVKVRYPLCFVQVKEIVPFSRSWR